MILNIIGIILSLTAIGLYFWLKKDQQISNILHEGDLEAAKHAYITLQEEFSHYQVENERKIAELEKQLEIKSKENERKLMKLTENLPVIIRKVVGHIEFAKPLDKK